MAELLNRAAYCPRPVAVIGFEQVQRYWDPALETWTAKILPGEFYVTCHEEAIGTVLGSCISACIRDPVRSVGGMNHFMLPEDGLGGAGNWGGVSASTRYGSFAMESLINELLKLGAARERLEVKLFGGGRILSGATDVGAHNIEFAKSFLQRETLRVAAEDVGGPHPRRVLYFPATGRVLLKHLRSVEGQSIVDCESRYRVSLASQSKGNDVELFE